MHLSPPLSKARLSIFTHESQNPEMHHIKSCEMHRIKKKWFLKYPERFYIPSRGSDIKKNIYIYMYIEMRVIHALWPDFMWCTTKVFLNKATKSCCLFLSRLASFSSHAFMIFCLEPSLQFSLGINKRKAYKVYLIRKAVEEGTKACPIVPITRLQYVLGPHFSNVSQSVASCVKQVHQRHNTEEASWSLSLERFLQLIRSVMDSFIKWQLIPPLFTKSLLSDKAVSAWRFIATRRPKG